MIIYNPNGLGTITNKNVLLLKKNQKNVFFWIEFQSFVGNIIDKVRLRDVYLE